MRWIISHINDFFIAPLVPAVLIVCGFYITARLRFLYVTKFKYLIKAIFSKNKADGVSSFRAVSVALAGTLGVGNILGVASAVCSGGPGAVFWMWIGAFLSMMIKYCEIVLAVKYRRFENGHYFGGAMYYIKNRVAAVIFALLCVAASFLLGNFMQIRALTDTVNAAFGVDPLIIGFAVAILLYLCICKGFKRLSNVTVVLIPFACFAYILFSIYVIIENLCYLPSVIMQILKSAFCFKAVCGGVSGYSIMLAVRFGISRGLVTNESGCGTAPMAHAEADVRHPVEQGFWGIFEVFADTILLCTLSAFVILISLDKFSSLEGMELVIASYSVSFGRASGVILSVFISIFAFSTLIGWSHYGKSSIAYLTDSKKIQKLYTILYSFCCIPAVYITSGTVWTLTDITLGLMTLINMFWILKKFGEVKKLTDEYFILP